MIQSPNDTKQYQTLTLNNGLRVLLVHNQESNRSAAALTVNVGHFDDPLDSQGLAHFLEHMLFLGTEKYPESGEYQQFLSQHSGTNNAWTATEHTCFYFDINHQHLEPALDRFSQFFIAPLLSEEFIDKERLNVDSEFKLKLKDDMRRIYDVHKETINQAHPFSKFSVGSKETLRDSDNISLAQKVRDFFSQQYLANRMTLCIEGPQSLATLERLVQDKFAAIKASITPKPAISQPLYLPEHLTKELVIRPEKNDHKLIISFALPGIDHDYMYKPISTLGYLLGHESEGSILSYLKKRQWAMSLTAAGGINGSNFKDFNISIRLTEEGEKHHQEIIEVIFAYIELIKLSGLKACYFTEKKSIYEFSFHYQESLKPIDSVNQLSVNMQHYPPEDYIYGDYKMQAFNPDLLRHYLHYLNPDNMRIICINQWQDTDRTSYWYKVPYKISDIATDKLTRWRQPAKFNELKLPEKNPYIVENPTVVSPEHATDKPYLIKEASGLKVWFKQDNSFFVPKGQIFIGIDSHIIVQNKTHIAMGRLFVELFTDSVQEQNYHAELAGIHYHLYPHQGGMTLQLSGINEKQPLLLKELLQSLKDHSLAQERFALFKKQLIKNWRNADKSKSISQLFAKLSALMKPYSPSSTELADALETVKFAEFIHFCDQFFQHLTIECFIYGNWVQPQAQEMANLIEQELKAHINQSTALSSTIIDYQQQGNALVPIHLPDHDYASVFYYPMVANDPYTMAITMITSHLISPQFFHTMRTEKQFGYLVGVGYVPMNRYPGIAFYIQSPDTTADALFATMDEFIANFDSTTTETEWQNLKSGLIGQLTEKDTSPRIKSQRYWVNICNKDYEFNQKEQIIKTIEQLSLVEVADFVQQVLHPENNPDRICLASVKHLDEFDYLPEHANIIQCIEDFHAKTPLKH
ncbi:insulinase family protein [Thalassotalea aquiviva]|uniref:insulinase family protein n=1 Tax=Thalassotalea aquiviva TaxID=3242415 RepID=UPI00352AF324